MSSVKRITIDHALAKLCTWHGVFVRGVWREYTRVITFDAQVGIQINFRVLIWETRVYFIFDLFYYSFRHLFKYRRKLRGDEDKATRGVQSRFWTWNSSDCLRILWKISLFVVWKSYEEKKFQIFLGLLARINYVECGFKGTMKFL